MEGSFWYCGRGPSMGAGEARLRSAQTGSLLPATLWGKSPCLGAESVSRRPRDPGLVVGSEATSGAAAVGVGHSQQHSHAVSAPTRAPTERGSLSPCLHPLVCDRTILHSSSEALRCARV